MKRGNARLLQAAGAEPFVLDRLCFVDDAPLSSEAGRVGAQRIDLGPFAST